MNLGAHMSIAGRMHLAFERGVRNTCSVIQVFVKNQVQWSAPPLTDAVVRAFKKAWRASGIRRVVAHNSYLVNLAAPEETLWKKSINCFLLELERCEALGIEALITHPGSHRGLGENAGLRRVAKALDVLTAGTRGFKTRILLETTAGQGTSLGHRFEHLRDILGMVQDPGRVGVCVDTCHIFAAGYDIRGKSAYEATIEELRHVVGARQLRVIHLNDSKREFGSRVDRHAHIGQGHIGLEGFRAFVNDPRFSKVPMILETPKEGDMDKKNLALLRGLRKTKRS